MKTQLQQTKNITKITTKEELRDIILSGKFDDSIQIKNTEHICQDGSIYDYSSLTDLGLLFDNHHLITTIPLFDTSNVTDMSNMFYGCSSLTSIPLLDTSNVTNIPYMFYNCTSLSKFKQVKFFYQKDKLLLKSLELNPELFSEQKLNELLEKYFSPF